MLHLMPVDHLVYGPPQHVQQVGNVLLLPDKEVGAALG